MRVVGISFEHMHMGDNLRMAAEHSECEIVGVCDSQLDRMAAAIRDLNIPSDSVFEDWEECLRQAQPDLIVLCPATGDHAKWVERVAPFGKPILMEKPMASTLAEADRMLEACREFDVALAINWPLVWVASHRTAKRLVDEGRIGSIREVHYYDGNRGPLWHTAGKEELTAEQVQDEKPKSWFYRQDAGGGSLLDYLGYGVTLGTWFLGGQKPIEVTTVMDQPAGLEVDEHSVTVARYEFGLSKFETRWGTFTDPWTHQPQPKCGFVIVGSEGTISSYDYEPLVRVQDRNHPEGIELPVDSLEAPGQNPIQYFVDCLTTGRPVEGPLSPEMSRIGQQIVDTAYQSAQARATLPLLQ